MIDPDRALPVPPPGSPPATCPRCQGPLDFEFGCRIDEIAWMTMGGEATSLTAFPVRLTCTRCAHTLRGTGSQFTIDLKAGVVVLGHIRPDEETP